MVTRFFAGLLLMALATRVFAATCEFPEHDLAARPETGNGPVEVSIKLYLSDLTEIHDAHQSFVSDVFFRAQWLDSRLAHEGTQPCQVADTAIWTPELQLLNRRQLERVRVPLLSVTPEGRVTRAVRVYGDFSFRADLSNFPFDKQELRFILLAGHGVEDVKIVTHPDRLGMAEALSVTNWRVQLRESHSSEHYVTTEDRSRSRLDVIFDAQRLTGFYTWQLLVPLFLVVMMTWTVFWLPLEFVAPRVGLVATSMLTLIAYRFSMASILPPIAYLTRLDVFMVASSVLVFGALAAAVAVTWLEGRGNTALAVRLNTASRALAPLLFLVVFVRVFVL